MANYDTTNLTDGVIQAIQEMHPDPFTQGAVWRLYTQAPGLLSEDTLKAIVKAQEADQEARG